MILNKIFKKVKKIYKSYPHMLRKTLRLKILMIKNSSLELHKKILK